MSAHRSARPPIDAHRSCVPVGVDEGDYFLSSAVELRPEETRCRLEDVVGPAELLVLLAQPLQLVALGGASAPFAAGVDLGLLDPQAQRLGADAQLAGDPVEITAWSPGSLGAGPGPCARPVPSAQADTSSMVASCP